MRRISGFTLIELMIAVVVVAILSAIALPSYRDYVTRGKITEATANLADLRVKMEQWYQDNRTYVGGPCTTTTKYFSYACAAGEPTATTFKIEATGVAGQGMSGFVYTINQANVQATTITAPASTAGWVTSATCWVIRKGAAPASCS